MSISSISFQPNHPKNAGETKALARFQACNSRLAAVEDELKGLDNKDQVDLNANVGEVAVSDLALSESNFKWGGNYTFDPGSGVPKELDLRHSHNYKKNPDFQCFRAESYGLEETADKQTLTSKYCDEVGDWGGGLIQGLRNNETFVVDKNSGLITYTQDYARYHGTD